jgi:hypothetical protein
MYGAPSNSTQDQSQSILQKIKNRDVNNRQLQLRMGRNLDRKEQGRLGRTGVLAKRANRHAYQRERTNNLGEDHSENESAKPIDPVEGGQHLGIGSDYESGLQHISVVEPNGSDNMDDATQSESRSDGNLRPFRNERGRLLQSLCSMGQSLHNVWSPTDPPTDTTPQMGSVLQQSKSRTRFDEVVKQLCANDYLGPPQPLVPIPTTHPSSGSCGEVTTGEVLRHINNTNLANKDMVGKSTEHILDAGSVLQDNPILDCISGPNTRGNVKRLHGMELYEAVARESLFMNDITPENARLLMTRKDTTMKTYVCAFMHLHKWCEYQGIEPLDMEPNDVVDYIMTYINLGVAPSTLSKYLGTITRLNLAVNAEGTPFKDTAICEALRFKIANIKYDPKIRELADLADIVSAIQSLPVTTARQAAAKSVSLLFVSFACRPSDLTGSNLDESKVKYSKTELSFGVWPKEKKGTMVSGTVKLKYMKLKATPDIPDLCPVSAYYTYRLLMEKEFGVPMNRRGLFFKLTKPFDKPAAATISKWFTNSMASSGEIATRVLAKDMRKLVPSLIANQGDLVRALSLGHWSQVATFIKHYFIPSNTVEGIDMSKWSS